MPVTHDIQILIDEEEVEIGTQQDLGLRLSYTLEDPENFSQKQGATSFGITIPATPNNDRIFNQFHNPGVEDLSTGTSFSDWRSCQIIVDGVNIFPGRALLQQATHSRLPESYMVDAYSQNGDWITQMQDLTLWDCLSAATHTFDVATVEGSWTNFDSDENHDYVYAPVRYRQPFGVNDNAVNIYHLRPSLSIYWMIVRGFRQFGYSINSQFLNTTKFFRRLVMPWTWGDFFDINSQLVESMSFKAIGPNTPTTTAAHTFWCGASTDPNSTQWATGLFGIVPSSGTQTVKSLSGPSGGGTLYANFRINNINPPNGYDNLYLYSFDDSTGTMQYDFNVPAALLPFIGSNLTLQFQMGLIAQNSTSGSDASHVTIQITHIYASGAPTTVTNEVFTELDLGSGSARTVGSLLSATIHNFYVSNVSNGDIIKFNIISDVDSADSSFQCNCACLLNTNPTGGTVPGWYYDSVTQRWEEVSTAGGSSPVWQQQFSYISMQGIEIEVGNSVNFKYYDKFRSYNFLDLLGGLVDMYNLTIQTDPILRQVTIEPTHDYTLPDGTKMPGYFKPQRIDWTNKQDISKNNILKFFSEIDRQLDFQFKQDGSDGGLNIYAARYKGIYLNNVLSTGLNTINNTNNDNGLMAAVPGASRYLFPTRFPKGNKQMTNRFFSATMHYLAKPFANINQLLSTGGPLPPLLAPQLICIVPENINDSSASAVTQTFEPKIAYYAGPQSIGGVGGWRWQGDPLGRGVDSLGNGIPTYNDVSDQVDGQALSATRSIGFQLPYMFAVDYSGWVASVPGQMAPVLTYCDQNVNGVQVSGLMRTFYLRRLATIRQGKQYLPWVRLNLSDFTDWEHQNTIIINGQLYELIGIDNFDPLSDDSCQCTLWKVASPTSEDIANSFPSTTSILTNPSSLPQFDLKYAPLLLFETDLPIL
jgi:hypothetical protein